jgi:hypothetical protein
VSEEFGGSDIPVFSPRLDELMASMLAGETPNVGRFCGYCYTPLRKKAIECQHCGRSVSAYQPVAKIPLDFFELYKRMRKREALIVNSFAFGGLGLGLLLFILLVALAVYRLHQSLWALAGATAVLIIGGRVFAGILGGWIGDSIGYDYAHRKLVDEWREYEQEREERLGRAATPAAPPQDATTANDRSTASAQS